MKKRFLIPLVVVAAPIAIGFADTAIRMAGCNFGDQGACTVLEQRRADNAKADAERALKAERKHVQQEAVAAPVKSAKPQPLLSRDQAIGCEILLQNQLKDPNSFRRLNSSAEVQAAGVIRYTATNSFGGRVQDVHNCAG